MAPSVVLWNGNVIESLELSTLTSEQTEEEVLEGETDDGDEAIYDEDENEEEEPISIVITKKSVSPKVHKEKKKSRKRKHEDDECSMPATVPSPDDDSKSDDLSEAIEKSNVANSRPPNVENSRPPISMTLRPKTTNHPLPVLTKKIK